jgi:hypothetical protein
MDFYNFQPDKMRLFSTEFINRSSSYFFYALLDNHPEIICGFTSEYPDFAGKVPKNKLAEKTYNNIINGYFYRLVIPSAFPYSFKGFKKYFDEYINTFGISNKTIFIATHYSLAKLMKKDISKVKWICAHTHRQIKHIVSLSTSFKDYRMIVTLRDPRDIAWSDLKHSSSPIFFSMEYYFNNVLYKHLTKKKLYIRHEDIHLRYPQVKKRTCKFLNITPSTTMDTSTVFGFPWDGSSKKTTISRNNFKSIKPDKKFVSQEWKQRLNRQQLFFIQKILFGKLMKRFDYKPYVQKKKIQLNIKIDYDALLKRGLISLGFSKPKIDKSSFYSQAASFKLIKPIINFFICAMHIAIICGVFLKQFILLLIYKSRKKLPQDALKN